VKRQDTAWKYQDPKAETMVWSAESQTSASTLLDRPPVIAARHVDFSFGEGELAKQILFDLTFEIRPGEVVLLTGPSGSGKTTLLTLIAALRTLQRGELTVLGLDLHRAAPAELVALRRRIGFIFQQHNLLEFLTAQQNVQLMFQLHPDVSPQAARQRSIEVLEAVGLGDHLSYPPSKLSGGQKQRVAVARALACRPELILADEPTAALDSQSGREVVTLLLDLSKQTGCPILMVTHDARVLDIADRIIRFEDGRIISDE
jgi:putative ABC transport system ATP-binding protein